MSPTHYLRGRRGGPRGAACQPPHRHAQESEHGVHAVGTCVRDRTGVAVAVAAPSVRCTRAQLADLAQPLLAAVQEIGREM
ncbi:IclR family transcriptional regulator C-terminal domain-containing protein [Streptomyces sp. NPDC005820]|uniref:IclR family transcriptional regulator domain-containing protein n=1 Tax=Streptomyces sp. NPDC005820 TaxID=3157069 RepID=UPI0033D7FB5B